MRNTTTPFCLLIALAPVLTTLPACAAPAQSAKLQSVPLSDVLNAVKDELAFYLTSPSIVPTGAGECFDPKGQPKTLELKKATVKLKVVDGKQSEAGGGMSLPISIVTVEPTVSIGRATSTTYELALPLTVTKVQPKITPPPSNRDYKIGASLVRLRDELLKVDHRRMPCLGAEDTIKLSIGFEVSKKDESGFSLNVIVFKFGDKATSTSVTTQTLDLELELTSGLVPR